MLTKEGGVEMLKALEQNNDGGGTQPNVRNLCRAILDTLAHHGNNTLFFFT